MAATGTFMGSDISEWRCYRRVFPKFAVMRILLATLLLLAVSGSAQAQSITYTKHGKTYVRLISKAPKHIKVEAGYDPNLLIPHYNPMTQKWAIFYPAPLISRTTFA